MSNSKQTIDEIKKAAGDKFSSREIDDFLNMASKLSSKAILTAVVCIITEGIERGLDAKEGNRLAGRIREIMPYKEAGYTCIELNLPDLKLNLNISLSLVDVGYKTEIDVPPNKEFINDLCKQYVFTKQTACAYWKQFCQEQPEIIQRLREYRPDVDFSELVIDPTNDTTMYFDPECKKRVGIFCYYTDRQGKPFYKKGGKK
jgi:hypothetical protein